jgi:hypothetical protein
MMINPKKNRLRLILMVLIIAACCALAWLRWHPTRAPGPADRPFTDLDTALASYLSAGWTVSTPPKQPGPYRPFPGETSELPAGQGNAMAFRGSNGGAVTEELRLESDPNFDQLVVYLETQDRRRTVAVLKRPR